VAVRSVVDRSWAEFFGVGAAELRAPGVRVVVGAPGLEGYRGLYLLRLGDGCTVGAPADAADRVRERVAGAAADAIYTRDAAQMLAGHDATLVLGPSRHAYLDAGTFVPPSPTDARRLGPDDAASVAEFRSDIDDAEWNESGFGSEDPDVMWGAFEGGPLSAMGNMTDFAGAPADVGLVTHPSARGRGLGTRLAGAMIADALPSIPVVRYRALETNVASIRVADRLGFVPDGGNIAVRLRT
jgi:RimJ/RimL family protein N-acetyltransferase